MLKSISWQEFLTVMSILAVIYYSVLGFIYYRAEIKNLFSGRRNLKTPDSPKQSPKGNSLVGQIREEEQIDDDDDDDTLSADQLNVAENQSPQDALLGTVADLLKDLKEIIDVITANKSSKDESLILIKAAFARYSQLQNTTYQQSINLFLYENAIDQFSFELPLDEIQKLWSR
jgi:hypothetical protein